MHFSFETRHGDGRVVVQLSGHLDVETAPILESAVVDIVKRRDAAIELDCHDLRSCDSAGLKALSNIADAARGRARAFSLHRPPRHIAESLAAVGLDGLLSDTGADLPSQTDGLLAVIGHGLLNSVAAVRFALATASEGTDLAADVRQQVLDAAIRQLDHVEAVLRDLVLAVPLATQQALDDLNRQTSRE